LRPCLWADFTLRKPSLGATPSGFSSFSAFLIDNPRKKHKLLVDDGVSLKQIMSRVTYFHRNSPIGIHAWFVVG